ncbi:MAG: hypothetical protein SWX82_23185 [Cyanobacteriota bacterium]|nr:hypothetical protein [Cyanobacteriota bacterium]
MTSYKILKALPINTFEGAIRSLAERQCHSPLRLQTSDFRVAALVLGALPHTLLPYSLI